MNSFVQTSTTISSKCPSRTGAIVSHCTHQNKIHWKSVGQGHPCKHQWCPNLIQLPRACELFRMEAANVQFLFWDYYYCYYYFLQPVCKCSQPKVKEQSKKKKQQQDWRLGYDPCWLEIATQKTSDSPKHVNLSLFFPKHHCLKLTRLSSQHEVFHMSSNRRRMCYHKPFS